MNQFPPTPARLAKEEEALLTARRVLQDSIYIHTQVENVLAPVLTATGRAQTTHVGHVIMIVWDLIIHAPLATEA